MAPAPDFGRLISRFATKFSGKIRKIVSSTVATVQCPAEFAQGGNFLISVEIANALD